MSDDPDAFKRGPATAVAHLGRDPRRHLGAVNTPVYRATTILFETVAELEAAERGEYPGFMYGLDGLPTVTDLQAAMAALEGGYAALAVPSGLAAITLALLGTARAGDHVLVTDAVYGPTRRFCDNQLKRLGIEVSYYDPLAGAAVEREFRSNTRVVFTESPGSLTFEVQDVPAIAGVGHANGALVMLDNTCATPLGFSAFARGAAPSISAATPTSWSGSSPAARQRSRLCTGYGWIWASRSPAMTPFSRCAACARLRFDWSGTRKAR
jgi:cystathionine beta-lyase